jgi:hypothetical protein
MNKRMENKLRGMALPTPRFLLGEMPSDLQYVRGYKNLQTFFPTLTKVFRLNKYQSSKVWFDMPWKLQSIDCSGGQGVCKIVIKEGEQSRTVNAYMKVTHLLDPVRWMQGHYSLPIEAGLPWHSKTWTAAWHKIQDPWNQAYVETMATYALSRLRVSGVSPHFNHFYGSFCARADTYRFNINDEYSSFRNTRWFWNGTEKGLYKLSVLNSLLPGASVPEDVLRDILTKPEYTEEEEEEEEEKEKEKDSEDETESADDKAEYEEESLQSASFGNKSFAEDEDDCDDNQYTVYSDIPNFPVMLILTELNSATMDSLLEAEKHTCKPGSEEWETMWSAWIFQVIAALCVMQKVFGMTHNDLHTNNVVWVETKEEFLYYSDTLGSTWKIPTFGKIFRLIDFGRSIFTINGKMIISDDFRQGNDAEGQYSFKPLVCNPRKEVPPNVSFDLARLAVSLFESLFPVKPADSESRTILSEEEGMIVRETVSPLFNCIWSWMVDDDDKNILMEPDGSERFPDFDLYKHIAEKIHGADPTQQIHKLPFSKFKISEKVDKTYPLYC